MGVDEGVDFGAAEESFAASVHGAGVGATRPSAGGIREA
jgi:hypothetical protein